MQCYVQDVSEMNLAPHHRVYHVAIADDWEASVPFGSYEAATRGVVAGVGQPIRTTSADRLQTVLDERYADLSLQVLVVELSLDALREAGIPLTQDAASGQVGIDAPLPPGDPTIVVRVVRAQRVGERWVAPDFGASAAE